MKIKKQRELLEDAYEVFQIVKDEKEFGFLLT